MRLHHGLLHINTHRRQNADGQRHSKIIIKKRGRKLRGGNINFTRTSKKNNNKIIKYKNTKYKNTKTQKYKNTKIQK